MGQAMRLTENWIDGAPDKMYIPVTPNHNLNSPHLVQNRVTGKSSSNVTI